MSMIKILALLTAIRTAKSYVTQGGTLTASSVGINSNELSNVIDNDFKTMYRSQSVANSWLQIQLLKTFTIATVYIKPSYGGSEFSKTSIYIGNDPLFETRKVCLSGVSKEGMYTCQEALTGNRLGIRRELNITDNYSVKEIRAYETRPLTITPSMLSDTSGLENSSLINSLSLDFTNYAKSNNGIWQVNFGKIKKIKAVLVKSSYSYWRMTFGDSAEASQNPFSYTIPQNQSDKEVLVESEGQFLQITSTNYQNNRYLELDYVAIFEYPQCNSDCLASSLANQVYYLGEQFSLTIPACSGTSATTQATLNPTQTTVPSNFATITKNSVANSFNVAFFSRDQSLAGQNFTYNLAFSDSSATSNCYSTTSFNVEVRSIINVDCSASIQSNTIYFISETTELTIPACVVTSGILINTIEGTLTSTGTTTPPANFATFTRNSDGSHKIVLYSNDVSQTGQSYQFTLGFSNSSNAAALINQPNMHSFTVQIKCARVFNCSQSVLSDVAVFIGQAKTLAIPDCQISPIICKGTIIGTLTQTPTAPTGFATMTKDAENSFKIQLSPYESTIPQGQLYQLQTAFRTVEIESITQNSQFSVTFCRLAPLVVSPSHIPIMLGAAANQPGIISNPSNPFQCGQYSYTISPQTQSNISISVTGYQMIINSQTNTNAGVYTFTATSTNYNANPPLSSTATITVSIITGNECRVNSFAAAAQIPNQNYVLGSPKILVPIPNLTQNPACGDAILYTLNTVPSFVQIEENNITLFGTTLSEAGTINVVLTAQAVLSGIKIDLPFSVIALNCTPVDFTATPSIIEVKITKIQAPANVQLSKQTGPIQCGLYSFSISPENYFIVLNGATITIIPTPSTEVKTYYITATSTMIDSPNLISTITIPVTVTCYVDSVDLKSPQKIADQSFEINPDAQQAIQISLPTYESVPCLKPITRTVVLVTSAQEDLPAFINYSDIYGTISVEINDPSKTGSYTLLVIATETFGGKQNLEITFKVTLTCTVTKFQNKIKNVESLAYLVGLPSTSPTLVQMLLPTYETTPSYCYLSLCKLDLKLLDSKGTKVLPLPSFISQTEDEIQIQTNDPALVGEYNFNLVATEKAGLVDSSVNFKVQIKCQIQNLRPFITPGTVQDLVYEMGGPSVKFTMPSFVWEPMACNRTITYTIENQTVGAASVSVLPEFMKFNAESKNVTLNGSLFKESGKSYLFKLVAFNAEDQQTNRDYSFTIQTTFKNKPPVFTQALTNQFLTVGMDASWQLPKLQDPENHEISSINVKIGKYASWLQFDTSTVIFSVKGSNLSNSDPSYVEIPIVVSDVYGATNEYTQKMFIQQSKEVLANADDSLLSNSTSNSTLTSPDGGNQTQNETITNTLSQNKTALVSQLQDFNSEPPLPSSEELVNLAANLTLGQEATQELASAIFSFPQLQSYFANLLSGRPINQGKQKRNETLIQEVKPKKEIPLQIDVTGVSALGQVTINSNQPIKVRVTDGKLPSFLFKAEFVGAEGSSPQTMDYEVASFNETQIVIQLKFDNPKAIGQGFSQDMVSFKLLKDFFAKLPSEEIEQRRLLQANEPHTPNMSYITLASQVPQQMNATSSETVSIVSTAAQAKSAMNSTFFFTFILQFIARGAMKGVWPLYSTLQILSVFLLYLVKVPSNVIVLSEQYNKIINMEFVPKEKIFQFIFKKNPELLAVIMKTDNSTMSDYATKSLGVGNPNMTVNICLMVATGIVVIGLIISLIILIRYAAKKYPKVKALLYDLKHMLMFNSLLRSLLQSYLQLSINTLLVFKLAKKDGGNGGNKFITVLTLIVLLAFPVFVFMFLKRMANWRKDFTLKDQFYLFCKSRKARRAYEIQKLENPVNQEEDFEPNQVQTELVLGNDIESCRIKAQIISKNFSKRNLKKTKIPSQTSDWMQTYIQNAKLQITPIDSESTRKDQPEAKIFDPLSLERNLLARKDVQRSFSTLYLNLDIYRETVVYYTVSLLVRRFMLAFVIAAFDLSFFQIWMTILISIAQTFHLTLAKPKEKHLDNFVIIANEIFIYACAVNLLLFTEYVEDANKRWSCGYSFMFLVLACAVMNLGIAIFVEVKSAFENFKLKYAAWKAKKQSAKYENQNEEEAGVDHKQHIYQLNPNFESSNDNLEDKNNETVREFGCKNILQMPGIPNSISYKENADFQNNSCVPEEMKDSFYIQERELVDKIAKLEEDDQDATVTMEVMKQIEEEDGEGKICTLSELKFDQDDKKKHQTYAKVHPLPEINPYFFDYTD